MCYSVPQRFNDIKNSLTCYVPEILQMPVNHLNGLITEQLFAVYFTSANRTTLE